VEPALVLLAFLVAVVLLVGRAAVHRVQEYQRLVVFRLGKYEKISGPGLILLVPIVQAWVTVDPVSYTHLTLPTICSV